MLSLKDFVHAIHDAVVLSNRTMTLEYRKTLDDFFEVRPAERPKDGSPEQASGAPAARMIPKTVAVEMPVPTAEGIKVEIVQVPLIALFPAQHTRISELTLEVDVELSSPDDNLRVAFPRKSQLSEEEMLTGTAAEGGVPTARLSIVVTPDQRPEGLNQLIEGYERALRAQLP